MGHIQEAAASAGVSWRVLRRLDEGTRALVIDAIFTREIRRTRGQRSLIADAHELTEAHEKSQRRMNNVNNAIARVNGGFLKDGQPRGQKRG